MIISGRILRHSYGVDDSGRSRKTPDDGRGGDSNFRSNLSATAVVRSGLAGLESADVPDARAGIGIERIYRIMFGSDNEYVVGNAANRNGGQIERLGID